MSIELNEEQATAVTAIRSFLQDDRLDAFVLRGSAGTGKTTLIAALLATLQDMNLTCALLTPTGRAARILQSKIKQTGASASLAPMTIHSAIYALGDVQVHEGAEAENDPGVRLLFPLKSDEPTVSLLIVDESSMVGDRESQGDFLQFGTGRLLADLVAYARLRRPGRPDRQLTKLLFVGDPAQLPPVGENTSPALSEDYLKQQFQLEVSAFDLKTVMRQADGGAILRRATALRDALQLAQFNEFSLRPERGEIEQTDVSGAADLLVRSFQEGISTVAVVHSNATALDYNRTIRERLWGEATAPIRAGDVLLVNRNAPLSGLNNGDVVKVMSVDLEAQVAPIPLKGGHFVELRFRTLTVAFRDGAGGVIETPCLVVENLLASPQRDLSPLEQRALLVHFRNRYPQLRPGSSEFRQAIRNDRYFNAVQVKFGYAMTCHKAQGGEWNTVIVDFGSNAGIRNATFFRWAYTAITRAVKTLVVVNAPEFTAVTEMAWARPSLVGATVSAEAAIDPDWNHLGFSRATAPLLPIHQHLRAAWTAQRITIEHLQHLQFCERYTLSREGKRAVVQYYYNGNHRMSRSGAAPGGAFDIGLGEDALAAFSSLSAGAESSTQDQFIQEFLDRLDAALQGSSLRRTGHKTMPYRLRVSFTDGFRKGDIDFTYDGSSSWTAAQEVGGQGSSRGLYDEIQCMMAV